MRWLSLLVTLSATVVLADGVAAQTPLTAAGLQPALGTAKTAPAPPTATAVPDRVVIVFGDDADPSDRQDTRAKAGTTVVRSLGTKAYQLLRPAPGQTVADAIAMLRADPDVRAVQRDLLLRPTAVPNDPLFGQQWWLRNVGLAFNTGAAVAGDDVGVLGAWDHTVGIPSTIVADIDSGYRAESPDLAAVAWTNTQDGSHGWDFIDDDNNPTDADLVDGGHGLHTAGIIGAAGNNGIGVTGVAQNVRIMPLRVCDVTCPTSAIIDAIAYASQHGARVANLSLGGPGPPDPALDAAITDHQQMLFVIAAGNDGVDNDNPGEADRSFPCINSPVGSAVDNVICVAATDQADQLADFSNYGHTTVDLGAPGTDILSTFPYYEQPLLGDDFEAGAPAFATNWPGAGFARVSEAPLTSFGIANSPIGSSQPANTVRTATSRTIVLQNTSACTVSLRATLTIGATHVFEYGIVENGAYLRVQFPGPQSTSGVLHAGADEIAAGTTVAFRVRYTTGSDASPAGAGAYVDDVVFNCIAPVGQTTGTGFLDGTSMATPMVTGAAALLFSQTPSATVTQVRDAILQNTDPVPSLATTTVTGGRLDVSRAMDALIAATAPPPLVPTVTTVTKPAVTAKKAVARCIVPKLAGRTRAAAEAALKRAHCRLGKVTKPRRGTRLRVKSSNPRAGTRRASGTKVALVLATKKRKR